MKFFKNHFSFIQIKSRGAVNPAEMIQPILLAYWSFFIIFVFCNFGEIFTKSFIEINHAIAECEWYSFPIELQRNFLIILGNTKKSIVLKGFGNIDLSRDTFKRVGIFQCRPWSHATENRFYNFLYLFQRLSTVDFHTLWCSVNSKTESTSSEWFDINWLTQVFWSQAEAA